MFVRMVTSTLDQAWQLARTGGSPPDKDAVIQRARPFGAAIAHAGSAAILLVRGDKSLATYLLTPRSRSGEQVASSLASAVSARVQQLDDMPVLPDAPVVGWLEARPRDQASRATQWGQDPTEAAQLVRRVMEPRQWVAISMRRPTNGEVKATRRWFRHRLQGTVTHYSNEAEALAVSVFGGGDSRDAVSGLLSQIAASLPGFDVEVEVAFSGSKAGPAGLVGVGVLAGSVAGYETHHPAVGAAIAVPLAAAAALEATGRLPTRGTMIHRAIVTGSIPIPPRRTLPPSAPRAERTGKDGERVQARPGSWPLAAQSFLLAPAMVIGLGSPHAGSASDASTTAMRQAPVALLDDIGPMVGTAGDDNEPVHISSADLWSGVAVIGIPGTGKTTLVQNLWAWSVLERVQPSSKPGRAGRDNTIVAFETKGDDVAGWQKWVAGLGDLSVLSEVGDDSTPAIDIIPTEGEPSERAAALANAMVYAFGDGEIQGRSYEAIVSMATAALSCDLRTAWDEAQLTGDANPINAIHTLLGGYGDESSIALASAITLQAKRCGERSRLDAAQSLAPYFGAGSTPSNRRTLTESSRNKTKLLLEAGTWWSPLRSRFSWRQALTEHWAVVVNTGPKPGGRHVTERLTDVLSAMLLYSLRDAIQRHCAGWQREGRSVSIFADELALLARNSPEVISWIRDQGRAYGVRPVFAAQYPEKLRDDVRMALTGFSTVFWFRQNVPSIATGAAAQLSMGGTTWTPADIVNLEPYAAILLATVDGQTQPPVPVRTYRAGSPEQFIVDQGYGAGPSLPAVQEPLTDVSSVHPYRSGGRA